MQGLWLAGGHADWHSAGTSAVMLLAGYDLGSRLWRSHVGSSGSWLRALRNAVPVKTLELTLPRRDCHANIHCLCSLSRSWDLDWGPSKMLQTP